MDRKPKILHLALVLTVAAFSCALTLVSCNNTENKETPSDNVSEQVQNITSPAIEAKPAFDDILAVAYNAVKGTIRSVIHHDDNTKIMLDVEKVYVKDKSREMNSATVSIAYASDSLKLAEGDECIIIVSQASHGAVDFHTDASYIAIRPEYNIIVNSKHGWCAEEFMSITNSSAYSPDKQYYTLREVERVLNLNSEKFKSFGAQQLVPSN